VAPKVRIAVPTVGLAGGVMVLHFIALHTIMERFYL
jgi:hypothetical protein